MFYDVAQTVSSELCYTLEVTANYTSSPDGTEWVDNSNFWYDSKKYGAYDTASTDLAVLDKSTISTNDTALTAAYWFDCGSTSACGNSDTTSIAAAAAAAGCSAPAAPTHAAAASRGLSPSARARSF